jgi:hypothetical protein
MHPQNVFHISGKTSVDIIASLENAPQMIQLIKEAENSRNKKSTVISH